MPLDLDQYVSLQHAAAACELDSKTLRRRIADGTLPAVRIGTRRPGAGRDTRPIRVKLSDLARLMEPVTVSSGAASS
ncbi:hypothetical protein GCM10009840_23460 [Pseudolysinimonas kribbensis]|uniref:DNA-binding protein n=1 Tax=Pseudolysinimonas kribbensis TaxID=433641 RepID=A0ABQ6KFC9_9MICO|nr:hypothetical protein [Pseudolysinimonas kribbensis]GMA96906.1 hypothetical protein GCM10025881_37300 [Pseudolysinimonas kribbensis]